MMNLSQELRAVTESVRQQAPAEVFQTMEAATARLAASGLAARALAPGQDLPAFELPDATGRLVRSADLLAHGPLVISFYRGAWCPYCNLELRALQERLPAMQTRGATLVAISPSKPDHSLSLVQKHALAFPVLSDAGNAVARRFGLVFKLDAALQPIYTAFGIDLPAHNGDDSLELPVPATFVIDAQGRVARAFVEVDYRERMDPDTVVMALDALRAAA